MAEDHEEPLLRSAVLQNAHAILLARQRAERELRQAKEALERKTAELARATERYVLAEGATNDGLWDMNLVTGEMYLSPRGKALLGFADDELANTAEVFFARLHSDDVPQVREALRRHHAEHHLYDVELRLRCKDDSYRWFRSRGDSIRDETGQVVRMLGSISDITARKQAEDALRDINTSLERRVQERTAALEQALAERQRLEREAQRAEHFALLGRLAAGVSHELRNPLGAIFLYVDLLTEELAQPSEDSAEAIATSLAEIKMNLLRVDDLMQDYLSLVRVSVLQREVQDLGANVQEWSAEFQTLAAARDMTFQGEQLSTLGLAAIHASMLRRALLNLIQNALDAMKPGETVCLMSASTTDQVEIQVRDTGCGIPAERLQQIFEPLYTTKPGGTGLGLYIVQQIVTAHGGQLAVESIEGQGTTFTITLPRTAGNSQ